MSRPAARSPFLQALPAVAEPPAAAHSAPPDAALCAALRTSLPGMGADWLPLQGGRSNRVWRIGDLVVKQYRPESATPLFPNDPVAEAAALRQLGPDLAPDYRASGAGWLAYGFLPGPNWTSDPAGVARLLAQVHRAAPPAGLRRLPMGAAAIAAHAAGFAGPGLPSCPEVPQVDLPPPVLVHGDPVPGNIVVTAQGLRLIDWQCPGLGDPVDDLALFLSPAMQWLYRGAPLAEAEAAAFLAAYPDAATVRRYQALRPLLHWRIAAHCAFRAARGDAAYAEALRLELA